MNVPASVARGWQVLDRAGRHIGTVDAVFADYLLVRTKGLLPVDLYVPVTVITAAPDATTVSVETENERDAYERWHRPLRKAPHD